MTHNDVARVLVPRALAARPLTRSLTLDDAAPPVAGRRALTRELPLRAFPRVLRG
ncbi:hypothetical protein [Kitasatospora sp. LaBMicrA B282]|uniref:hypothetical protein n=1 Tax=Kitasatospora sp. LaBMicrA B282 TaxID=3420949 RepID=UPI003D0B8176